MQTKVAAKLCSICRTIPFDGLLLPSISETETEPDRDDAAPEVSGFYDMGTERSMTKIDFGLMSRSLHNEEKCDFCAMVGDILRRHPTSPFGPQDQLIAEEVGRPYYENLADKQDRPCQIKLMWFVGINHPDDASKSRWTGRLLINWKDDRGAQQGAYSCFQTLDQHVGKPYPVEDAYDPFSHRLLCGGRRRPLEIDLGWIKKWLEICTHEHQRECTFPSSARTPGTTKIRLIDVQRMCIIEDVDLQSLDISSSYMALSYVRGQGHISDASTLLSSTRELLQRPTALEIESLPRTFVDFISLAQALEIPYVWIDVLCIIQDDREDKMMQIAAMNAIYQHAFMTVVAASGDSVDSGLAGMTSGSRKKSPNEITIRIADLDRKRKDGNCDYITLIETLNHPEHTHWTALTSTVWNTRAWTYQEKLLSRRTLIFTKEQLYWTCQEAGFCEETVLEFPQDKIVPCPATIDPIETSFHTSFKGKFLNTNEAQHARSKIWKAYGKFVAQYSDRHMSYDGDVYAAFAGILQAVSECAKDELLLGHPRSRFEHGLSWDNFRSIRRRADRLALPLTPQSDRIVVPSWSWMGWHGAVGFNVTLEKELDGTRPVVECFVHRTSPLRIVPARAHASSELASGDAEWIYISQSGLTAEDVENAHPHLTSTELEKTPDETVIFFWASTCRLRVQYPDMTDYDIKALSGDNSAQRPKILDADGNVIGEMQQLQKAPQEEADGKAEFVVIEQRSAADPEMAKLLGDQVRWTVLQIGWRLDEDGKPGLCQERLNIGYIDEQDWTKANPQRKLIALQ